MSPRPSLTIAMPPGFEFQEEGGQLPRTPEHHNEEQDCAIPPPPPRQTYKIKRKRTITPFVQLGSDSIIPTIEMSEDFTESSSLAFTPMPLSSDFLAPAPTLHRSITPPKTPIPQSVVTYSETDGANEWDLINNSRVNHPTNRAPSVLSDSSVSSVGSSAFSAPQMPTSPQSEATDPFMDDDLIKEVKEIPLRSGSSPCVKRVKTHRHVKWTQAMDDHLWMTYMSYLADPTVTPFKMLPGTAPPLGVCHRVATKARRTWSPHRSSTPVPMDVYREGTPETIRATDSRHPQWPRSDSATRRRLRLLCKRKPSLSAHYQRLLRTRSPSPFTSSSSTTHSSEPMMASAFSSRELNVSLVTATAPSMQPEGPLAQLAQEDPEPSQPQISRAARPDGWFSRIGRSKAHQKSLSLQSGLGLDSDNLDENASLASPFDEISSRSHLLQSMNATKSLGRNDFKHGKLPALDPPFEGDPTMRRSLKRRFRSDEEKPKRLPLEDVFGSESSGIVRNRGFSLGAVRASDNLAKLFTPQSEVPPLPALPQHLPTASTTAAASTAVADQEMSEAPELPSIADLGPFGSRSVPRRLAEPTPRLGSPFVEAAAADRQFNTFPRSYLPSSSNPQPFQQRLKELAAQHSSQQPQ